MFFTTILSLKVIIIFNFFSYSIAKSYENEPSAISVFISDVSGKRFEELSERIMWTNTDVIDVSVGVLEISPEETYQKFDGLGGSFMRSGAQLLDEMPEDVQKEILFDLFDQYEGM